MLVNNMIYIDKNATARGFKAKPGVWDFFFWFSPNFDETVLGEVLAEMKNKNKGLFIAHLKDTSIYE